MTRLHVVTGKGGTGKTTVAAALAMAAAAEPGSRVLICEVDQRQGLAATFGTTGLGSEERTLATVPGGGEVVGLALDAEAALTEYLTTFYRLGPAGKMLTQVGAIDFATTLAPGLADVLLTGKVYEAARRRQGGRRRQPRPTDDQPESDGVQSPRAQPYVYDAVILDAPPTGRIGRFLNVNSEVAGLARVGPIHHQASAIMRLLQSDQACVHVVTLPAQMPVTETCDAIAELDALGLAIGSVIVNQHLDPPPPELPDHGSLGALVGAAQATALIAEGQAYARDFTAQQAALQPIQAVTGSDTGRLLVTLPQVPTGVTSHALPDLADRLATVIG